MADRRRANQSWYLTNSKDEYWPSEHYQMVSLAVLQDIRDEVTRMRKVLECSNTIRIPGVLDAIEQQSRLIVRNTTKVRRQPTLKDKIRKLRKVA